MKFNTKWIPYIIIGVLAIVLYFVLTSQPKGSDENLKITAAEARIDSLENLLLIKDSIIIAKTKERDNVLDSVRTKITDDEKNIKIRYIKAKDNITNLSDDESIELLRENLKGL